MALKPAYYPSVADDSLDLSQEGLRSLLGQIEAELYRSKVYRRALASLQTTLGETTGGVQVLFKAVGREAIKLALLQFANQLHLAPETPAAQAPAVAPPAPPEESPAPMESYSAEPGPTSPAVKTVSTAVSSMQEMAREFRELGETKPKKLKKAELAAEIAVRAREERLRQICQEIREARAALGISLQQLHQQTLVPIHQIQALEAFKFERLPEDIYVRGFIRRIGDALGLNGTTLAASLPAPDPAKTVVPSWYHPEDKGGACLHPVHLYLGYAALMAGAVGGLHWVSSHQAPPKTVVNPNQVLPSQAAAPNAQKMAPNHTPGLAANELGIVAGPDIAPPEAFSN